MNLGSQAEVISESWLDVKRLNRREQEDTICERDRQDAAATLQATGRFDVDNDFDAVEKGCIEKILPEASATNDHPQEP